MFSTDVQGKLLGDKHFFSLNKIGCIANIDNWCRSRETQPLYKIQANLVHYKILFTLQLPSIYYKITIFTMRPSHGRDESYY